MSNKIIGTNWNIRWYDFISTTVKIVATRDGVLETIALSADNPSIDIGSYNWNVTGPSATSFIVTIIDNINTDISASYPSVSIVSATSGSSESYIVSDFAGGSTIINMSMNSDIDAIVYIDSSNNLKITKRELYNNIASDVII